MLEIGNSDFIFRKSVTGCLKNLSKESIGALLILLVNPVQALVSILIYSVVQFVETQFIYPHVVGNSVGLSPLLTLVAALIGGNLFGIPGIVFFIPLTAVAYTLISDYINKKLKDKNIDIK